MRMVALVLVVLGAFFSLAGGQKAPGTMELLNTPVYGGMVEIHVYLPHKYRMANSVLKCGQFQADGNYRHTLIQEQWLNRPYDKGNLDIIETFGPLQSDQYSEVLWDSARSATCMAVAYQDWPGKPPFYITNEVRFTVEAVQ